MSRQIAQPSAHYELAPDEALALIEGGATWHYHPIESGLQDFRRPLTLSLSPSDGERVAFRPGEGNTCVTSAWWWCRVAPPVLCTHSRRDAKSHGPDADPRPLARPGISATDPSLAAWKFTLDRGGSEGTRSLRAQSALLPAHLQARAMTASCDAEVARGEETRQRCPRTCDDNSSNCCG